MSAITDRSRAVVLSVDLQVSVMLITAPTAHEARKM